MFKFCFNLSTFYFLQPSRKQSNATAAFFSQFETSIHAKLPVKDPREQPADLDSIDPSTKSIPADVCKLLYLTITRVSGSLVYCLCDGLIEGLQSLAVYEPTDCLVCVALGE